ncbi:MAG: hypothetical protein ACE5F1_19925, partial [Planctomycetota bacterium]
MSAIVLQIDKLPDEVLAVGMLVLAAAVGFLVHMLVYLLAGGVAKRTQSVIDDSLIRHSRRPLGLIL